MQPCVPELPEDVRLVRQIATQDRQAFDTFYTQYGPRLRRYITRLPRDQALVDDVSQDVMLVVWQQAAHFPATIPIWAWLCGIARHKARKAWARTAAHALVPAGPAEHQVASLEVGLLQQETERVLAQALDALPFYERTVLQLRVQQGYAYRDIAQVMDTPLSTVRTRVWRACQRLRVHVAAQEAALAGAHLLSMPTGHTRRHSLRQSTPGVVLLLLLSSLSLGV
jgi:RNA polymerase sigma factor (sigma-70 family)